jgi:hypothetical protein
MKEPFTPTILADSPSNHSMVKRCNLLPTNTEAMQFSFEHFETKPAINQWLNQDIYKYFTERGFKPKLNVMDNQCSKAVLSFIKSTGADIQLVNPDDHRVNAAERAMQTWKNHWIAGLGTLDPNCPLQLWCQFIEQGQDTLNMLCMSRINPKLSSYAALEGQFNFNKTPLEPVGTKALVFLDPNKRNT